MTTANPRTRSKKTSAAKPEKPAAAKKTSAPAAASAQPAAPQPAMQQQRRALNPVVPEDALMLIKLLHPHINLKQGLNGGMPTAADYAALAQSIHTLDLAYQPTPPESAEE